VSSSDPRSLHSAFQCKAISGKFEKRAYTQFSNGQVVLKKLNGYDVKQRSSGQVLVSGGN
jgi:hypothetical protein